MTQSLTEEADTVAKVQFIPLILSLLFGLGVYLVYEGLTSPRPFEPGSLLARRLRGFHLRLQDFLAGAGLADVTPRQFVLASVIAGLAVAGVTELVLGWPFVALVAFGVGLVLPFGYYAARRDCRRAEVQRELADAIDQLRLAVQAGRSVPEALAGLAHHGPEHLRPEFAALVLDQRLRGLGPALQAMKGRLADPVVDVFAEALILSERTGGRNVTAVLEQLARAVRGQLRVLEEVRAQQARHRLAAQIIAALPIALLLLTRTLNPEYLAVYDTVAGQAIIGVAILMVALGYAAMLQLGKLPGEERVFR